MFSVVAGLESYAVTASTFATPGCRRDPGRRRAIIVDVPPSTATPVTCPGLRAGVCWPAGEDACRDRVAAVRPLLVKVTIIPPGSRAREAEGPVNSASGPAQRGPRIIPGLPEQYAPITCTVPVRWRWSRSQSGSNSQLQLRVCRWSPVVWPCSRSNGRTKITTCNRRDGGRRAPAYHHAAALRRQLPSA